MEENGDTAAAITALEAALSCDPTRQEAAYLTARIAMLKEKSGALSG
jgi:cytochrome c-type biogenesis protein CcmH/NrfG